MSIKNDLVILSHLRQNARKKVTEIARDIDTPVTTIYDRIRAQEKKGIVQKHTTLIDFSKLGYMIKALIAINVSREKRDDLATYLIGHPNVNSLYRVDFGHDFVVEMVFEDKEKLQDFIDRTDVMFSLNQIRTFNILQELKKEVFLSTIPAA